MNTPEVSKLNWLTKIPTYEEVKDFGVVIQYQDGMTVTASHICSEAYFGMIFTKTLVRYAILNLEEEPLPLWGKKPDAVVTVGKKTVVYVTIPDKYYFEIQCFTRTEAISAWNELAEKLNEIQETK